MVRRRLGASLPLELNFSLGMRKYLVLLTEDRGVFPTFFRELGHYVVPEEKIDVGVVLPAGYRFTYEIPSEKKGKNLLNVPLVGQKASGVVERCSRPGNSDD